MNLVTVRSVQNGGGEQGRRFERVAANHIEDQEPDGDDDAPMMPAIAPSIMIRVLECSIFPRHAPGPSGQT